jgi:hypothetical protein
VYNYTHLLRAEENKDFLLLSTMHDSLTVDGNAKKNRR